MRARPPHPGPIRVLWAIKGLGVGGAEQLLASSAKVADHERFRFDTAFIRPDKQQLVPTLEAAGVTTHLLGAGRRKSWTWPAELRRLMAGADVVHSHSPLVASLARLAALTLPRSRRPVLVSTEHNVWGNFSWPTRLLNAATCLMDAQRWSVSRQVRRSMWGRLGKGAPVLVHGIIQGTTAPDPSVRATIRESLGLPADAVVTITVANLRREKDYPTLLRAGKIALAENPSLVMLAVGQGPLSSEIADLHRTLGLGDRFRLLGFRTDVPDLLAASDLMVMSSLTEGLPVSIMEAMSQGLPIVATAVGGVPEAVTDGRNGLLVPSGSPEALADAIGRVAGDDVLRARLGRAALEAGKAFDIRDAVAVQQAAYERLVNA